MEADWRNDGTSTGSGQLAEAEWLAHYVATDGAGNLVLSIGDLVRSGRLETGARLPTVRVLGASMGVSASTVAAAWAQLRRDGLIETRRRGGTVVVYEPHTSAEPWQGPDSGQPLDLAQGLIDLALLPNLAEALAGGLRYPAVHRPGKDHVVAPLLDAVAPTWPFKASTWTTVGSSTEGALLAVEATLHEAGSRAQQASVAIESPTSPRLLDICRTLGVKLIAVPCDEHGPLPDALRAALRERPAAFLYQPRAQVPLGHSVPEARALELATELDRSPCTCVVEDDFFGPLARDPAFSIGAWLPERTLFVRNFDNAFGIDLRTCVVAGSARLIDRLRALRSHGAAMNSRILQCALAFLLTDAGTAAHMVQVRERYASRRLMLAEALRRNGFTVRNRDGLGIWLPVRHESRAIVGLAEHGISVGAGSRCFPDAATGQFLRLSTGKLPDGRTAVREIAEAVKSVA